MEKARAFSWPRFFVHCSIVVTAVSLGLMSWFIAKPTATRIHQTMPGERVTVAATPHIDISLDADSMVTVSNTEPPRIELLKGNAYFDVRNKRHRQTAREGRHYLHQRSRHTFQCQEER